MRNFRLFFLFFLFFCQFAFSQVDSKVNEIIQSIQKDFVPDKRTGVYEIKAEISGNKIILNGETDNKNAINKLVDRISSELNLEIENNILLLPDTTLKGKTYAIVSVSVANMRKDNDHDAEMVSQVILGTVVKVLKKKGGFYLIQSPDDYLGWVESGSLVLCDENGMIEWKKAKKIFYNELFGIIYSKL